MLSGVCFITDSTIRTQQMPQLAGCGDLAALQGVLQRNAFAAAEHPAQLRILEGEATADSAAKDLMQDTT